MKRATDYSAELLLPNGISIHALMKRATLVLISGLSVLPISIHALMKRATGKMLDNYVTVEDFNPRPHEEGDRVTTGIGTRKSYFNPRPHEEGDVCRRQMSA